MYCEPFFGGGAMCFELHPEQALINDFNQDLINVYEVIKNDADRLIEDLKHHKNEADYFYSMRGLDREVQIMNLEEFITFFYTELA